jgi:FKBP-type peptidyl-prolyl cis-trans isomerase
MRRPFAALLFAALALTAAACKKPAEPAESALVTPGPAYSQDEKGNAKFLTDYAAQKGVIKTADGLLYRVLKAGTGKTPLTTADMVTVLYKGQTVDGKVFDETTPDRGPATFPAGALIPGWIEALAHMKEGDEWEIVVPYQLGYGEEGHPPMIPARATLVFRMTLQKVEFAQQQPGQ